jgi:cell division protein FtsZ
MAGARGLLINITGGDDLTLFEVDQAANRIREEVDEEANVIFGSAVDESLTGRIRVSVVATGIDLVRKQSGQPSPWVARRSRRSRAVRGRHGAAQPPTFVRRAANAAAPVSAMPAMRPAVVDGADEPHVKTPRRPTPPRGDGPGGDDGAGPQCRTRPAMRPAVVDARATSRAGFRGLFQKATGLGGMMRRSCRRRRPVQHHDRDRADGPSVGRSANAAPAASNTPGAATG